MYVDVIVELSAKAIDKTFTYQVPPTMFSSVKIGKRVLVPFGRQKLEGFIVEISTKKEVDYPVKEIIEVIDQDAVLNEELLKLGKYMQKKTLSSLVSCYQTMLPRALKAHKNIQVSKKYETYYILIDSNYEGNKTQNQMISLLKEKQEVARKELLQISISSLNTLEKKHIIKKVEKEVYRLKEQPIEHEQKVNLTNEQKQVIDTILSKKHEFIPYLLHGVTGSGKTEVYIKLISKVIEMGKTAIMLVPEISLTPQMVNRFSEVFGDRIAALHSALSEGEKYDEWRRISRGEADIVIGARSAIFAPLNNLGIIIIDEEHSDSYKQDTNPRYNAKDIAIIRSKTNNCPVIMGSATPSLESFARANKNVYKLLIMNERVNGKKLPDIKLIDMNQEIKKSNSHISIPLLNASTSLGTQDKCASNLSSI